MNFTNTSLFAKGRSNQSKVTKMVTEKAIHPQARCLITALFCLTSLSAIFVLILISGYDISSVPYWRKNQIIDINEDLVDGKENSEPLILIWERPFLKPHYGPRPNRHCGCRYSYDQSLALQSDVIVVYCQNADISRTPPDFPNRKSTQRYIWWCREPPPHVRHYKLDMNYRPGYFNWTMTYRRDSDVSTPWDTIENVKSKHKKTNMTLQQLIKNKNKSAIAVVSNCGSAKIGARSRLEIIKKMKTLMPIDTFGSCFKNRYKGDIIKLIKQYKFYLLFENSYHCKDYISEKFWSKAMGIGLLPVVWGPERKDYEAVAPNSSFIYAEDFETIEDLVKYMLYLDKNDTAYLEYFQWRTLENLRNVDVDEIQPPIGSDFMSMCILCRHLLNTSESQRKSTSEVKSIKEFILDSNDRPCLMDMQKDLILWRYEPSQQKL